MRIDFYKGAFLALCLGLSGGVAAQDAEIESLRSELDELRADYDARLSELERRLALAEQIASRATPGPKPDAPVASRGNTAFNPAIGVIFSGSAWRYSDDPAQYVVQGFPLGGEAGPIAQGLALGETELILNANVDDKFTAWLTAALAIEDGEAVVEVEEAWVEATALPAGFGAKFGRFFSGIGYLNSKHAHAWDFADQPLPYQAFLAGQLTDDGVQIRWVAPTDLYMEFGSEVLRGNSYPAAGGDRSGFGSHSLFVNFGGDVGASSSWLAGASYLDAAVTDRISGDEADPFLFSGDTRLLTTQFVWKWAPNGNWRERNLVLQAEFMQREEEGAYSGGALSPVGFKGDQRGWYAQAVYQPIRRWRFGGRVDALSSEYVQPEFGGTLLAAPLSNPRRFSLMADWANSEFSRIRLQFTKDEAGVSDGNQWGLQYIHSIGAHGAHSF